MRDIVRATVVLLVGLLGAACSGGGPGTVLGDVYVVLESGMDVNVGNVPVRVVRDTTALDSILSRICAERSRRVAEPAGGASPAEARSVALEWAWAERERVLSERTALTTRTTRQARFVVDSVPPGSYRLWADATVAGERWTWLTPVRVRAGDTTRVNLSNGNNDDDPFRCAWDPRNEGFLFR